MVNSNISNPLTKLQTYYSENRAFFVNGLEGTIRSTGVVENTISVVRHIFPETSYTDSVRETLSHTGEWLNIVDLINIGTFWYDWKSGSVKQAWQNTASFACTTARNVIGCTKYLVTNYSSIASSVGGFPVIKVCTNSLRVAGGCFAIWHQYNVIGDTDKKIQSLKNEILQQNSTLSSVNLDQKNLEISQAEFKKTKARLSLIGGLNHVLVGSVNLAVVFLALKVSPVAMLALGIYHIYYGCFVFFHNTFRKAPELTVSGPQVELGAVPAATKT